MTIYVRQSGTWTAVATPYVRIAGVWTAITKVYRNIGGTWTQVYPGDTIFSSGVSGDVLIPSGVATITSSVVDSNGNLWTHVGGNGLIQHIPSTNETTIRVAANVVETYWSSMTWGVGSVSRSSRTSFTAWNGTYTQWKFAANPLNIDFDTRVMNIFA